MIVPKDTLYRNTTARSTKHDGRGLGGNKCSDQLLCRPLKLYFSANHVH